MKSTEQKKIVRSWLASLLMGILGHRYRGIAVKNTGVTLLCRTPRQVSFSDIMHPLQVTKTLGRPSVSLTVRQGDEVKVAGLKKSDAVGFVTWANDAWRRHFVEQVDRFDGELRALAQTVGRLDEPKRYPSACLPACPECSDGWLVERKGKWGKFLGCVRYPDCKGKKTIPKDKNAKHKRRPKPA